LCAKKAVPQEKQNLHLSKDFNWLQLKSIYCIFFADELVIFVVLVVFVVSGVQHVDCVTFFTLSFSLLEHATRERERERKEEEEEEQENEKKREKEKVAFVKGCKRLFFLLLAAGSALEKFAAIVSPENKPTKVNWTLSWPSALEICGKTVL